MSKDSNYKPGDSNSLEGGSAVERIDKLLIELRALLTDQQNLAMKHWGRSLPFADYISDRWKKAMSLGFGEGSSIYDSALVIGNVKVGKNTWIGPFTVLDGSGGIEIGDNCSISAGVQIYSHDSVKWANSGGEDPLERAPVLIGKNSYIGPNTIISKGVKVGCGCVIGTNSFVNRDIPDGMKAWGTPAIIRE